MRKMDVGEKRKFHHSEIEWHQIGACLTTGLHKILFLFTGLFCNTLNGDAANTFISLIIRNFVVINDHTLTKH